MSNECKAVPVNCRQRLAAEGKPYPRSGCASCGQMSPNWRECDSMLSRPVPQSAALGGVLELDGLSFQQLRQANVKRLASSKYKLCEQNWQPAHWMNALTGEVGECANIIKKVDRGDYSLEAALPNIARELADIQCYLDILAFKLGIDLGAATVSKFDEVSERIGSPIRLGKPVKKPEVCEACNGNREIFYRGLEDGWYEPCNACSPTASEQA
ncbi:MULTISPECIES: MazG-like family protein [Pseudomonas syringae group]|uniref:MazG-like family protein n=1 Tax=Pseudomonas syringae group TaxID=136849 RepID=UPI001CEFAA56|nr:MULTISPECIES: MazG-like family protein [Pseudomonas syringae group]